MRSFLKFRPLFLIAASSFVLAASPTVDGQSRRTVSSGVQTSLAGVQLFDSAMKLLDMYGHPAQMINLGGGGGGGTGGGGGAGPAARGGGGRGGGARGGAGGGVGGGALPGLESATPSDASPIMDPDFNFGFTPKVESIRFFGGGGGGGGGQGGSSTSAGDAIGNTNVGGPARYMRWVYNRPLSRYSFIIDKNFRIVQIEAVLGADDPKVRSVKGIRFGSSFTSVLKAYGLPDAYDITPDTIVMRYLVRHKVAFRLNKLEPKGAHRVTAMVLSGGKA